MKPCVTILPRATKYVVDPGAVLRIVVATVAVAVMISSAADVVETIVMMIVEVGTLSMINHVRVAISMMTVVVVANLIDWIMPQRKELSSFQSLAFPAIPTVLTAVGMFFFDHSKESLPQLSSQLLRQIFPPLLQSGKSSFGPHPTSEFFRNLLLPVRKKTEVDV